MALWPRQHAFAVHAEASPAWALDELARRVRAGDVAGAQGMAATLAPFWKAAAGPAEGPAFLAKALRVARALDQPSLAAMLLDPFAVEALARSHVPPLVALADGYGEGWTGELLTTWSGRGRRRPAPSGRQGRDEWVMSLAPLCEALHPAGSTGTSTARLLVQGSSRWLGEAIKQRRGLGPPSRRDAALAELAPPALALLESTAVIAATDLRDEVLGCLCDGNDDLLACLMQMLRAESARPGPRQAVDGLDIVGRHCAGLVQARLACPPRADEDWSIDVPGGCICELCKVLGGFLTDPARRAWDWPAPLAAAGRRHVHSRIDSAELPVRHQTRRAGRPYTLVLTKTEALFEREMQARRCDEADLAWLCDHDKGSSVGPPLRH